MLHPACDFALTQRFTVGDAACSDCTTRYRSNLISWGYIDCYSVVLIVARGDCDNHLANGRQLLIGGHLVDRQNQFILGSYLCAAGVVRAAQRVFLQSVADIAILAGGGQRPAVLRQIDLIGSFQIVGNKQLHRHIRYSYTTEDQISLCNGKVCTAVLRVGQHQSGFINIVGLQHIVATLELHRKLNSWLIAYLRRRDKVVIGILCTKVHAGNFVGLCRNRDWPHMRIIERQVACLVLSHQIKCWFTVIGFADVFDEFGVVNFHRVDCHGQIHDGAVIVVVVTHNLVINRVVARVLGLRDVGAEIPNLPQTVLHRTADGRTGTDQRLFRAVVGQGVGRGGSKSSIGLVDRNGHIAGVRCVFSAVGLVRGE